MKANFIEVECPVCGEVFSDGGISSFKTSVALVKMVLHLNKVHDMNYGIIDILIPVLSFLAIKVEHLFSLTIALLIEVPLIAISFPFWFVFEHYSKKYKLLAKE